MCMSWERFESCCCCLQVHGKLFKSFFGVEPDSHVRATGFSIRKGRWVFRSGVFNKDGEVRALKLP